MAERIQLLLQGSAEARWRRNRILRAVAGWCLKLDSSYFSGKRLHTMERSTKNNSTISISMAIFDSHGKFPEGVSSWYNMIQLFDACQVGQNKMKPTNPNAHTYVPDTDVQTHDA